MSRPFLRIVKLGGSLLDWPPFAGELPRWLGLQSPAANVLVVGGGELAEAVRRLDEIHHLSPRDAHWLAAETMHLTAKFVAMQFPESQGIVRFDALKATAGELRSVAILDAWQFLCEMEPQLPGMRLPESWDTTSDSIAARAAVALDAEELVLLKSSLPLDTDNITIDKLAATGYVDAALPRMAAGLKRVRCVNLRSETFVEVRLL